MKSYNHKSIEKKWQNKWKKSGVYKIDKGTKKKKFFILDMFPYPSGEGLHVGHPKGYIATDIISRMKRMQGFNVLHPMGFDAFGLPAENYAIKTKTNPVISVSKNIKRYKKQLEILGFDYDWDREVTTIDPKFYKWTQWIFLKLLEKGLAYESFEPINWCPSCKTGLANEDLEDGKCERCGSVVEKKPMRQWVLKITNYADRLLDDLDLKDKNGKFILDWPESIKESQRNWIGRSEGAEIDFQITGSDKEDIVTIFTTRPDTLFGVTYVVLSPELVSEKIKSQKWKIENLQEVNKYIESVKNKSEIDRTDRKKEKTGVQIKGIKAVNPANKEVIPVWVSDYVLSDYGTGAVMAVPAHDQRDFEFAKKFGLNVKQVIAHHIIDKKYPPVSGQEFVERKTIHAIVKNPKNGKYLCLNWKNFPWVTFVVGGVEDGEDIISSAKREVLEETGYKNLKFIKQTDFVVCAKYNAAHKKQNRVAFTNAVFFELINEEKDKIEDEELKKHEVLWLDKNEITEEKMTCAELPVWLDNLDQDEKPFLLDGIVINSENFTGKYSIDIKKEITKFVSGRWVKKYKLRDWVFSRQRYWGEPIPVFHDENGKIIPLKEKELPLVLPKVKSYEPTGTGESPLASIKSWVSVKTKNGLLKRETNTMPQWAGSSWYYIRYMDPKNNKELVSKKNEKYWNTVDLYVGGAEHATRHLIYARFWHKFLYDIGVVSTKEPFKKLQSVGLIIAEDGRKMSKRFGNIVNPDSIAELYGSDTLRVYEMFMGPFADAIRWDTKSIIGCRRFLEKVWRLSSKVSNKKIIDADVSSILNKTIIKVTEDIESMRFNTAISALMVLVNFFESKENISKDDFAKILLLLSPFAPHISEELWQVIGNKKSIAKTPWPKADIKKIKSEIIKIVIQVNGKVRGILETDSSLSEGQVLDLAKKDENIYKWFKDKEIKKVIYVENKVLNVNL